MLAVALTFHHVGVITTQQRLAATTKFYERLGYSGSELFQDPIQKVSIRLMTRGADPIVEIIAPSSDDSPAAGWVKRIQAGPYHTCYQAADLDAGVDALQKEGLVPLAPAAPAVAFGGRRVVFLWAAHTGLLELVEA